MRSAVTTLWFGLVLFRVAYADRALRAEELQEEADLIVVGRVEMLTMLAGPAQFEPGRGNADWLVNVTIKVHAVEKGVWTQDEIDAQCFRIKSRASYRGFLSPSGHWPIPDIGTSVRAHLRQSGAIWEVVLPNGLSSPNADVTIIDAQQIAFAGGEYTYLLPVEAW